MQKTVRIVPYLYLLVLASTLVSAKVEFTKKPRNDPTSLNIGYITLDQPIESFGEIVKQVKKHTDDSSIDCIILHINSPGGRPGSSQIIADFIAESKRIKPIIAFISDSGTSGAYWVAAACSYIIAPSSAIVGSIGVVSEYPKKNKAIAFTAGKYKRVNYLADGVIAADDAENIQERLDKTYDVFCENIAQLRSIPVETLKSFEAQVYLGEDALKLGLIDQVGTIKDVFEYVTSIFADKKDAPASVLRIIASPTEIFEFAVTY